MKQDSIPIAVIAAFLDASQLAFSMPVSEAKPARVCNSVLVEPVDHDEATG